MVEAISDIAQNKSNHLRMDVRNSELSTLSSFVSGKEDDFNVFHNDKLELSAVVSVWSKNVKGLQQHLQKGLSRTTELSAMLSILQDHVITHKTLLQSIRNLNMTLQQQVPALQSSISSTQDLVCSFTCMPYHVQQFKGIAGPSYPLMPPTPSKHVL